MLLLLLLGHGIVPVAGLRMLVIPTTTACRNGQEGLGVSRLGWRGLAAATAGDGPEKPPEPDPAESVLE